MAKETNSKKENKVKGFFARLAEKIDRKMEEKARKGPCSCGDGKDKDNSCRS